MPQQQVTEHQRRIAAELGVRADADPVDEAERRTAFLTQLMTDSGRHALVLGVSGGVDSATAGALCKAAATRVPGGRFIAVRLPYGTQLDDADAQLVLDTLQPHLTLTVDIQPATDATIAALAGAGVQFRDAHQQDFVRANVKARQRMIAQYAIASLHDALVIGTDHAAEAVTGFFTKYGDGGVDATPLSGLTKRQVKDIAALLGVPAQIVAKTPTADLEDLRPQRSDQEALGLAYAQIDTFLESRPLEDHAHDTLLDLYAKSAHKRVPPYAPAQ